MTSPPGCPARLDRRQLLAGATAALGATTLPATAQVSDERRSIQPFSYCLNTSTIRGQNLDIVQEVEIAAKAGYDSIEPWLRKIDAYREAGGSLKELGRRIADHGLRVESAIGFAQWIVDDDAKRKSGLETARRDMDTIHQIGGTRIAAPPAGATRPPRLDLFAAAERYAKLLEVGDQIGVTPQLEVWGFSHNLSRLGEVALVAVESGHPSACILPDIYHIFRGGSDFAGLKLLSRETVQVFHLNDYPANPPRTEMKDADRVYPGDGVAPVVDVLRMLAAKGGPVVLSLELFNPGYWKQDAGLVASTGLERMKQTVAAALKG